MKLIAILAVGVLFVTFTPAVTFVSAAPDGYVPAKSVQVCTAPYSGNCSYVFKDNDKNNTGAEICLGLCP